jgi:hypothetical protein
MNNTFEKLQLATLCLSQDGSIKDRLAAAYDAHLNAVEADSLPENLRADFGALCAAMHREAPQVRESAVRASVRKMSTHEASSYAAMVVRLFAAMARVEAAQSPASARAGRSSPVVQLFAAEG